MNILRFTTLLILLFAHGRAEQNNELNPQNTIKSKAEILLDKLPSDLTTEYFFEFVGSLILGLPIKLGAFVLNTICEAVVSEKADNSSEDNDIKLEDIAFQLRTPCTTTTYPLTDAAKMWSDPHFNPKKRIVIAASGWTTTADGANLMLDALTKAYNCRGDTNFLALDDGQLLRTFYSRSALNTDRIGELLAKGLVALGEIAPIANVHLIGHSLGAHIVGAAGYYYHQITGQPLPYITGLDPAAPCFIDNDELHTISSGDADFVDIIHTNPGVAGQYEAIGDADFFVGGKFPIQKGCFSNMCSHNRVWEYFVETVYPGGESNFIAKRCRTSERLDEEHCQGDEYPMGFALPRTAKGIFFLTVNPSPPYGKNSTGDYNAVESDCGDCPDEEENVSISQ